MAQTRSPIKRLLKRHDSEPAQTVDWNVKMVRSGPFRKEERFSVGVLRDISLEGALIELPDSNVHENGDRIHIRLAGLEGRAEVCHRRVGHDGHFLYGVRILADAEFQEMINATVGDVRGHSPELIEAWNGTS